MYPVELEIKDTTESNTSLSYLDLLLSIGRNGKLHTSIYDKRDYFNFHIINFPFLSSNIPTSPAYGVFISQLIRYVRACSSYGCFTPYTMTTPTNQTLYRTRPFAELFRGFHRTCLKDADRGRLLLRIPGPVPLGLAYVLHVEANRFSELVVIFFFRTMLFEYLSVLSRFC